MFLRVFSCFHCKTRETTVFKIYIIDCSRKEGRWTKFVTPVQPRRQLRLNWPGQSSHTKLVDQLSLMFQVTVFLVTAKRGLRSLRGR